jgi:hypothetical protein
MDGAVCLPNERSRERISDPVLRGSFRSTRPLNYPRQRRSKARARGRGSAAAANLLRVSLEPLESLDHHPAGRKRVRILVGERDRQENLGKARIRSRRFARIPSGGNDEVVDRVAGALHALKRDAAAMSTAEKKAPGFRKQRWIGRLGHADGL